MKNSCCFFGHRKIKESDELKIRLSKTIEELIVNHSVKNFLFGSRSDFDELCYKVVTELKEKYPVIKRIYVRAEYPIIDEEYKEYLLKLYEDTYYPEKIKNSGKAVYIKRNFEMIDNSDFCVIYYNKEYSPPKRKNSKKDLTEYQPKSGTKTAYEYAVKKGARVININE